MFFSNLKFSRHYLPVLTVFVLTLGVALTVVVLQQQQGTQSRAAGSDPQMKCFDGTMGWGGGANCVTTQAHHCCSKSCVYSNAALISSAGSWNGHCDPDPVARCKMTSPVSGASGSYYLSCCNGSLASGTLSATCRYDGGARSTSIRLSDCGGNTISNIGGQLLCDNASLALNPASLGNIPAAGGIYNIGVLSNTIWTSGDDSTWITTQIQATVTSGHNGQFRIIVDRNTGASTRTGRVLVKATKAANPYVEKRIDITQLGTAPAAVPPVQTNSNPPVSTGNGTGTGAEACVAKQGVCQTNNGKLPTVGASCTVNGKSGSYEKNLCKGQYNAAYRCCVPAPVTEKTQLSIPSAFLHIIGKAGDSVLTGAAGGGNEDPEHSTRDITINISDLNGVAKITNQKASVTLASTSGAFATTSPIDLGSLPTGEYKITIKMDISLPVTQTVTLTSGQTTDLPTTSLVTGNTNNSDDVLNIQDWNMLLDCFSDINPAKSCNDSKKQQTDITDDGSVNLQDFNIFIRECKVNC